MCLIDTIYHVKYPNYYNTGLSSLGVPGVPWHTQIFADQLTLFQPGGAGYVRHINTCPSRFSELPPALSLIAKTKLTLKRIPAELNASPVLNLKNVDVFLSTPHNSGETLRQPQEISSPKIKIN